MHARVATFEGGDAETVQKMVDDIKSRSEGGPPEGVPATGFLLLHSADDNKVIAIGLFDSEEDLNQGNETLNAMDPPIVGGLGQRSSVDLMEVAVKVEA